ncbi:MAG: hypothetical protein H6700_04560 [Myxococcales bacterium]|nr:hypothetical protein [Myxococcales bacterium]MCB9531017.1 hypothetical protein [Myxococcales bacterium]
MSKGSSVKLATTDGGTAHVACDDPLFRLIFARRANPVAITHKGLGFYENKRPEGPSTGLRPSKVQVDVEKATLIYSTFKRSGRPDDYHSFLWTVCEDGEVNGVGEFERVASDHPHHWGEIRNTHPQRESFHTVRRSAKSTATICQDVVPNAEMSGRTYTITISGLRLIIDGKEALSEHTRGDVGPNS